MQRRQITILAPTPPEAGALDGLHTEGVDIKVVISGVGMAETAAAVARIISAGERPDLVVLAGVAGAYPASGLTPGDCVCAHTETVADLGAVRGGVFTPLYTRRYESPLAARTGLRAVDSATVDCIGGPSLAHGFDIENMEGAAFFSACAAVGLPFVEVRAVSNLTTDPRQRWDIPKALAALGTGVKTAITNLG